MSPSVWFVERVEDMPNTSGNWKVLWRRKFKRKHKTCDMGCSNAIPGFPKIHFSFCSTSGFLNLSKTDIWARSRFVMQVCPMHLRWVSRVPDLCLGRASSTSCFSHDYEQLLQSKSNVPWEQNWPQLRTSPQSGHGDSLLTLGSPPVWQQPFSIRPFLFSQT